ncbi:MAG: 2'-5' RNA ligase [Candidatus Moranbacteria bacterium GW2011_GWC2_37_73]|nr:MAG: 2'-5' RNA ligase, 2'-5' RNA ligase [Parcubacteria group bacterium GW2011_GWC1_36_108]KKQ01247.1 MAG: 2'-5' RNA ligase [Candidatus Moranbacteria bacterium GW2011_GWD1_36_198]KKQ02306.1 MAG: 2'-5' RNA ligase [Candidatus Moranbacteria bacterium GW2011_GWD2_36_198]KKQ40201.1 MAG: 2'-5' RNA ligase [Candidatus Moranbacteria bacterium GW2011_GWC2_37_73]HAR99703.1 RNA 2',3'-cyclic phosphodiesterase [Candidatus Moranbacteria bacterium]
MQKKKIFVEIEVPGQLKRRLAQIIAKWSDLPIKWMKEENLHITVSFVGYVDESVLPEICQKVRVAVENFEAFDLEFDRIELGPNPADPKTVWLTGQPCSELGVLNEQVERALGMRPETHKEFRPHITLGRIRKLKWDELVEKPEISEKINVSMTVDSLSIMESKGGGAEYVSLEECSLA